MRFNDRRRRPNLNPVPRPSSGHPSSVAASISNSGRGSSSKEISDPLSSAKAAIEAVDIDGLLLRQDYPNLVKTLLIEDGIFVGVPGAGHFFRTLDGFEIELELFDSNGGKGDPVYYILKPGLRASIAANFTCRAKLYLVTDPFGHLGLVVVKVNEKGVPVRSWTQSLDEIVELAKTRWVSLKADPEEQRHQPTLAVDDIDEPVWPQLAEKEILALAFGRRRINTLNHRVLRGCLK